jgi:hypothetical protein
MFLKDSLIALVSASKEGLILIDLGSDAGISSNSVILPVNSE